MAIQIVRMPPARRSVSCARLPPGCRSWPDRHGGIWSAGSMKAWPAPRLEQTGWGDVAAPPMRIWPGWPPDCGSHQAASLSPGGIWWHDPRVANFLWKPARQACDQAQKTPKPGLGMPPLPRHTLTRYFGVPESSGFGLTGLTTSPLAEPYFPSLIVHRPCQIRKKFLTNRGWIHNSLCGKSLHLGKPVGFRRNLPTCFPSMPTIKA